MLLEAQDRSRWDAAAIAQALRSSTARSRCGARPARTPCRRRSRRVHAQAPRADRTDWRQIALLYAELERVLPTPVVALNRAVAVAMADGPAAGLAADRRAAGALDGYHLLHAARADLLRREGRTAEAATAYARALELATNAAERRFLAARLAECER